jgi:integrase
MKGVHFVRYRRSNGRSRWYVYAWRGGPVIGHFDCERKPSLSPREWKLVIKELEERRGVDPTTLMSLIREWRSGDADRPSSPEWTVLAPGTKRTWGSALDLIEKKWGSLPLEVFNDPRMAGKIVAWRDSRAATPRAADIGITVLRSLLEFGRLRGRLAINVASNIPTLYRNGQRAAIVWTADDMDRFAAVAKVRDKIHVFDGLRLAALTGLRREDLVTLTWAEVGEHAIEKLAFKRSKGKRRRVTMPRIPALDKLLEELGTRFRKEGVNTVLVNSFGESWSGDGFGGSFNRVRDEAGIEFVDEETGERKRKHLHDVRGTFCTRLLTETDLSDREIADIMGWSPDKVASIRRVYVDQSSVVRAIGARIIKSQNPGNSARNVEEGVIV